MQKKLIALAVASLAAGSAFAQSSVNIGGWMTVNVKNYKVSDANTTVRTNGANVQTLKNEVRVDDDSNSRIWFTGKEDLGGGMDAHFYMESRFGADNGSGATTFGLAAGDTFVGLTTPYGTVDFGRVTTYYTQGILTELDKSLSGNNQLTLTALSTMGTMVVNNFSRNNNNIRYTSPRIAGFQGSFVFSPGFSAEGTASVPDAVTGVNNNYNRGNAYTLAANYMNGPIYLNAAWWKATPEGTAPTPNPVLATLAAGMLYGTQESYRLSGSYSFPFGLKVGLSYDHFKVGNLAAGTMMPSVFAPLAAYSATTGLPTVAANYLAAGGGSVATNGSISRNTWILPVSYAFGKNTVFFKYGQAGNIKNWSTAGTARAGGTGAKFLVLGYDYALSKRTALGASYAVTNNDGNGVYQAFAAGSTHTGTQMVAGETVKALQLNLTHRF